MKSTESNPQPSSVLPFQILLGTMVVTTCTLFLGFHFMKKANAEAAAPENPMNHTNRLANEKSPYLLQHAHNPVDWYPWGDEAFAKAKLEDKMIFLSVGYAACLLRPAPRLRRGAAMPPAHVVYRLCLSHSVRRGQLWSL